MRTLDSSLPESTMENISNGSDRRRHLRLHTSITSHHRTSAPSPAAGKHHHLDATTGGLREISDHGDGDNDEESDPVVWETFSKSFSQVQSVLDRNRVLIQQVNENHQSKIPDNLVKNVALIRELNGNISKVRSLYSDLSVNFSTMFHQRNGAVAEKDVNGEGDDTNV